MALQASHFRKTFHFCFTARTSRGTLPHRTSWFVAIGEPSNSYVGIGEASPLPGLSKEYSPRFEKTLLRAVEQFNKENIEVDTLNTINTLEAIRSLLQRCLPHVLTCNALFFAFETALLDFAGGGQRIIFKNNSFVRGKPIPINGLVWMDEIEKMWQKTQELIKRGFRCIKIKVGGGDFEQECEMLKRIRARYSHRQIVLRLDANGAFCAENVYSKLEALHHFGIHSIEQPLPPGMADTAALCAHSPIPIALDEELIGVNTWEQKNLLLRRLKPAFIILKPTLHGGLYGCKEWIKLAEAMGIGWWITSALESNIGLNAIAQFAGCFNNLPVQGLGTGTIYRNNIDSPLFIEGGNLAYDRAATWAL